MNLQDIPNRLASELFYGSFGDDSIEKMCAAVVNSPEHLPKAQAAVAQAIRQQAEGAKPPLPYTGSHVYAFTRTMDLLAKYPALLAEAPPALVYMMQHYLVREAASHVEHTLKVLGRNPVTKPWIAEHKLDDPQALLARVTPEMVASIVTPLVEKDSEGKLGRGRFFRYARVLSALKDQPGLLQQARALGAAQGMFAVPAGAMTKDQYGSAYDIGVLVGDKGVAVYAGECHKHEPVAQILAHWTNAARAVTPNRREHYIPRVLALLDEAGSHSALPEPQRKLAQDAAASARAFLKL